MTAGTAEREMIRFQMNADGTVGWLCDRSNIRQRVQPRPVTIVSAIRAPDAIRFAQRQRGGSHLPISQGSSPITLAGNLKVSPSVIAQTRVSACPVRPLPPATTLTHWPEYT